MSQQSSKLHTKLVETKTEQQHQRQDKLSTLRIVTDVSDWKFG